MAKAKSPKKDLAAAKVLGTYDDKPIVELLVAIVGAGDGLSKSLGIDPIAISLGDEAKVVLATHASQIKLKPMKDNPNFLSKTIVLTADLATIADDDLVDDVLEAQQVRLDEAAGIKRIPFEDSETGDPGD